MGTWTPPSGGRLVDCTWALIHPFQQASDASAVARRMDQLEWEAQGSSVPEKGRNFLGNKKQSNNSGHTNIYAAQGSRNFKRKFPFVTVLSKKPVDDQTVYILEKEICMEKQT